MFAKRKVLLQELPEKTGGLNRIFAESLEVLMASISVLVQVEVNLILGSPLEIEPGATASELSVGSP